MRLNSPLTNGTLPTGSGEDFAWLVGKFLEIINLIIPLIFALALGVFIWGLMNAWILGGGDQARVDKGKKVALAGVIGLVVMAGVWGIIAILQSTFF